jgi:hypothetical protein
MKSKSTVKYGCGNCDSTITVSTSINMDGQHPICICGTNVPMYEEERVVEVIR